MKKALLTFVLLLFAVGMGYGQKVAVKTNALGWLAGGTVNAGVEAAILPKLTVSADGYYNPFKDWGKGRSTELWGVQPEVKYWFCKKFYGHYIGAHGQYSQFDAGMFKNRYEGTCYGAGVSYGYSLPIGFRWRLDFSVGVGWKHRDRDVYKLSGSSSGDKEFIVDPRPPDNIGITKAGVSAVFIIR